MPFQLEKTSSGYFVVTKGTRRRHNKKPLTRARAVLLLRALYANVPEARRG